ncbi:alpha/beta fold hydrolase [Modestobacter sp. SYSU DS0511]
MTITNDERPPAREKPTVVLVHGAFAESASWNGVIEQLRSDGHPVIAAANPLRGLRYDADQLRSILDQVRGPIVLAGHSYGGSVMSVAADGHPGVRALVYVGASCWRKARAPVSWPGSSPATNWGPRWTPFPSPTGTAAR